MLLWDKQVSRAFVEYAPWRNTQQAPQRQRMQLREILARNVRTRRAALGMTQEDLAARAEIDRTSISNIERSACAATVDMIARLARGLETTGAALLAD